MKKVSAPAVVIIASLVFIIGLAIGILLPRPSATERSPEIVFKAQLIAPLETC